ncbi:hypothetical protein LOZ65_005577 [Ophidiomyces ophidiicola]|nr:hypothetical protein LOZ65_005577 [Ophidiomyces ophidiicola]
MADPLPPDFIDIPAAKRQQRGVVNVIGVVIDTLPPKKCAGSSYVSTFTLKSSDFTSEYWYGLKIRYFSNREACSPKPDVGDVLLLRGLHLTTYNDNVCGLSKATDNTPWAIFRKDPKISLRLSVIKPPGVSSKVSSIETACARSLSALFSDEAIKSTKSFHFPNTQSQSHSAKPKSGRFSLLKDANFNTFVDIVGQVVKTFSEYERYTLYVTDYTQNKNFFDYAQDSDGRDGDDFSYLSHSKRQWPGPYGRMTIQITLWEPHADFARKNIKEDDFVLLCNVHVKPGQGNAFMEGALHTDRQYPDKICVHPVDFNAPDDNLTALVKRKQQYWKGLKTRVVKDTEKHRLPDNENSSNNAKRNKRQNKKKALKGDNQASVKPSSVIKRDELNSHIRANFIATPTRTIKQILENESHWNMGPDGIKYQLPFQNLKYRASIRVVDFFPPNLEDFAVQHNPELAILGDDSDLNHSDEEPTTNRQIWQWRFCLLVEDGGPNVHHPPGQRRERLKLFVADADAVFLLSLDAVNLRENPEVLAELREKLFILWGDLEERKSANSGAFDVSDPGSINTKPFICCIKEYGVPLRSQVSSEANEDDMDTSSLLGWENRFRMFDTSIM